MIRLAGMEMIDRVMEIFRSATVRMQEMNIDQWDEVYPDRKTVENDIESGNLYGYFDDKELCAVQVLNTEESPEYSQVDWKYSDSKPLVLHRLCVAPEYQNRGIAGKMIHFAEEFAEKNRYRTIRFDAFKGNPVSLKIYEKMGYRISGTVRFRKGDFHCFEKKTSFYRDNV